MKEIMLKVTMNDVTREYHYGTRFEYILADFCRNEDRRPVLAMVNGKLRELMKTLTEDCTICPIYGTDKIGFESLRRSTCFVLIKAIYDVIGMSRIQQIINHFSVGPGFYFTISSEREMNQALLDEIKERMDEMIRRRVSIEKESVHVDDAIEIFHRQQMYNKERLLHYRRASRVNLYNIEGFRDYFYGFMAPDAGYIEAYDLIPYSEGFILQLPTRENPKEVPPLASREKIFQIQEESEIWGEKMKLSTVGLLNDKITHEGLSNLLLIQEARHEAKIAEIAEQIVQSGSKKFVMIAGPSSSGKTTFSHRLSIQLRSKGMTPHPIALDNYFVNRTETPLDEYGEKDYECLEALDIEQFNKDMLALMNGERVELPVYNFKTGMREYRGDFLQLGEDDILVIEGIHGLNDRLSYSLPKESKFKVYISALTQLNVDDHNRIPTTDGRLIRRMVRDARTRGTGARETLARWDSVRRGEEKHIFPFQEQADAMFNSSLIYELACLKVYAEPLLFGIAKDEPEYLEAKRLLKFFDYFVPVPGDLIPRNSLLREFIGDGCFDV